MENMSREEVSRKIASVSWYHRFEVLPGVMTPGVCGVSAGKALDSFGIPRKLPGKKVLDIGTFDGPYAFELENRDAEVTAFDIQDPDSTGFNVAKELRKSNVRYVQGSVYDLAKIFTGKFDIICFFGVYYHLKHPILAFEQIYEILADGGMVLIEGECLRNYAETLNGKPVIAKSIFDKIGINRVLDMMCGSVPLAWRVMPKVKRFFHRLFLPDPFGITAMADSDIPLTVCYPGRYRHVTGWFVPNLACIRSWLDSSGLELVSYHFVENVNSRTLDGKSNPCQRINAVAGKLRDKKIAEEHPVFDKRYRDKGDDEVKSYAG